MRYTVDASGRFLRRDGRPWFLLADTAWELFHRLDRDEADHYLAVRAEQGFNTVLAVGLAEFGGLTEPNAYGDLPLVDRDPGRPHRGYWEHVDRIIASANRHGLVLGLLPTWGSHWHDDDAIFGPADAVGFARWLAERYVDRDIIWVLGGDRTIDSPRQRATIDGFAAGIRDVVGHDQLITFHPRGHGSSKDQLADADWLDLDLVQSGHLGWHSPNHELIGDSYHCAPLRPVIEGEPNYEAHPVMTPDWRPVPDWVFTDADVRRAAHRAVFAGSAGFTYGATGTYQMLPPGAADPIHGARISWRDALALPGAVHAGHLGRLFTDLGIDGWEPAPNLLDGTPGFGPARVMALARGDAEVLVYLPPGRAPRLVLAAGEWRARWWDPRDGTWSAPAQTSPGTAVGIVSPWPDDDGVLHLHRPEIARSPTS